jgi:RNA polymerase sigma factor (TIGR02999 family)
MSSPSAPDGPGPNCNGVPDVTVLLEAVARGNRQAAADLLPLVYDELRKLAAAKMANERADHTLDATALVHEAFLKLGGDQSFASKSHFFRAAAEAMRRILVDHARRKGRLKRGSGQDRVELGGLTVGNPDMADDLVALDEALTRLEVEQPEVAAVVKLRYFAGLTTEQAGETLGLSPRTANRHWAYAKAWLYQQLSGDGEPDGK